MRRAIATRFAHANPRTRNPLLRAFPVVVGVPRGKSLTDFNTEWECAFIPSNDAAYFAATGRDGFLHPFQPRRYGQKSTVTTVRLTPRTPHAGNSITRQKCCSMPIAFRKLWPGRCFSI